MFHYTKHTHSTKKVEKTTFTKLEMKESDLEEMIRLNVELVTDDEESIQIIGKQVKNEKLGRSDLTAIDQQGNIILIEIKRDRSDIEGRKEAFEFQAIRYAASYATITTLEEAVNIIYGPYLAQYDKETIKGNLTANEAAMRELTAFLEENESEWSFNEKQRIILVASDFDEQTLSAVAWLNQNGVDMSCFKLTPYIIDGQIYIDSTRILPVNDPKEFYVNLWTKSTTVKTKSGTTRTKRTLPKIDQLIEWGVVSPGDTIRAKNRQDTGKLTESGNVLVAGQEISLQNWLKQLYGWSSVQTYMFAIDEKTGKTLSQLREDYMNKLVEEELAATQISNDEIETERPE